LYLCIMEVYHYVYHLIDPVTGQFYYGSRTCKGITPQEDVKYKGSMTSWKPEDKTRLVKTILKEFSTREEAILYEIEMIKLFVNEDLNENYHIPTVGFSTLGLPSHNKKEQDVYINEVTKVHNGFFTYPRTIYIDCNTSIIVTCPIHGDFPTNPSSHLKGHGCPYCSGNAKKDEEDYINSATLVHNGYYTYPNINYVNNHTNILVCCPNHGDFPTNPKHHLLGGGCPDCYFERNRGLNHSRSVKVINVNTLEVMTVTELALKLDVNSGNVVPKLKGEKTNDTGHLYLDVYEKMTNDEINEYKTFLSEYKNPRNQKVINVLTKEIFPSIKDAANSIKMKRRKLSDWLDNKSRNKTFFILYDDYKLMVEEEVESHINFIKDNISGKPKVITEIINVKTKEKYHSINEAAKSVKMCARTLGTWLKKDNVNKTFFMFYERYEKLTDNEVKMFMKMVSLNKKNKVDKFIKVINIKTNTIYNSIVDAQKSSGIPSTTFSRYLYGKRSNTTDYRFCD